MEKPENTSRLVFIYNRFCNLKPSEAAKQLVASAVSEGLIKSHIDLSGNRLKMWALHNSAPEWACEASFRFLISAHYQVDNELDRELFNYYQKCRSSEKEKGDANRKQEE